MKRYIKDQPYKVGMTCADINFFTQYMGRSIIKDCRLNDHKLPESERIERLKSIRDTSYLTMKQSAIVMPNGRIAQVSTQQGVGSFHSDALAGTYEVIDRSGPSSDDRRMEFNVNARACASILADIAEAPPLEGLSHGRLLAISMPQTMYRRELHGRFLYDDFANFDPNLVENRVLLGDDRWATLRGLHGQAEEPVLAINAWCEEHCTGDFAWTTAGPIWSFRDHRDAFQFRITWG